MFCYFLNSRNHFYLVQHCSMKTVSSANERGDLWCKLRSKYRTCKIIFKCIWRVIFCLNDCLIFIILCRFFPMLLQLQIQLMMCNFIQISLLQQISLNAYLYLALSFRLEGRFHGLLGCSSSYIIWVCWKHCLRWRSRLGPPGAVDSKA